MFKLLTKLVLGASLLAAFFPPGVPSNPPFNPTGTKDPGDVPTVQSDGTVAWAAGGGGVSASTTPIYGEVLGYNDFTDTYDPVKPGAGVIDAVAYGASGRGEITTTGTASAASTTLTLASASTFAKGQGLAILGAGATHAVAAPAAPLIGTDGTDNDVTYTYSLYSLTGDGGWSTASSTGASTDAVAGACGATTLSSSNGNYICWATVSGAEGYGVCGRGSSNRFTVSLVNGAPNARRLTFGADPNFTIADIGTTVTQATTGHTGILLAFSNTGRVAYVKPTVFGTDTFSGTANSTTAVSGRGGTTNAAGGNAHYWHDSGDASTVATTYAAGAAVNGATQPSLGRRASTTYYAGQQFLHPMSNAGVRYVVHEAHAVSGNYSQSSSTASGSLSLGTTVGTLVTDGDLRLYPMPGMWPVAEPSSAMPNALLTTIAAISGTTVTLANATGNAITSQTVWHNDWKAFSDAWTVATAANPGATKLYFKPGNYLLFTADSEVDTFNQWGVSSGTNYLFSATDLVGRSIELDDAATIYWFPMSHRAAHEDTGDKDFFLAWNQLDNMTISGGRWIYSPAAEPEIIASDAWNRTCFFGDFNTGASQWVKGATFRDAEFWNFCRWGDVSASFGYGMGHTFLDCKFSWGGGGHDPWCYGGMAEVRNSYFFGDEGFGSDWLYTPDYNSSPIADAILIDGNKVFKSRTNGARLRTPKVIVTNNQWTDCAGDVVLCDYSSGNGMYGIISDNTATNGGRFNLSGRGTRFNGNTLRNVQVNVAGGFDVGLNGGAIQWDANADLYFTASTYMLSVTSGTRVSVSGMQLSNADLDGDFGGITVVGGTDVQLLGNIVDNDEDRAALDITTAFDGTATVKGGIYDSAAGQVNLCRNASAIVTCEGVTFRSGANSVLIVGADGTLYFRGNTSYLPVNFTTNLDYLEMTDNTIAKGAAGTCTVATPNAKVDNNVFGVTPVMTSITGLNRSGNQLGTNLTQTMTALSGNTDNLLVGICDTLNLTTSGTNNYNLTGLSGLAVGNVVTLVNSESSGSDIITLKHATTSTAGNQFFLKGATDYAMDPGDWVTVQVITAGGATYYREVTRGPL